jgi:hypothetical protein
MIDVAVDIDKFSHHEGSEIETFANELLWGNHFDIDTNIGLAPGRQHSYIDYLIIIIQFLDYLFEN